MGKTKIVDLLDRLEGAIEGGRRIPLLNKVAMDRYELLEIVDQIRICLPEEVRQAEWLLTEKERILAEATAGAEKLKGSAKEHLAAMVSQEQVVEAAEAEATRIIEEAKVQANETRKEADEYAAEMLSKLEEHLQRALKVVRRGVEELRRK